MEIEARHGIIPLDSQFRPLSELGSYQELRRRRGWEVVQDEQWSDECGSREEALYWVAIGLPGAHARPLPLVFAEKDYELVTFHRVAGAPVR